MHFRYMRSITVDNRCPCSAVAGLWHEQRAMPSSASDDCIPCLPWLRLCPPISVPVLHQHLT